MKELDMPVINVILNYSLWQLSSEDIKPQRMNELDIPVTFKNAKNTKVLKYYGIHYLCDSLVCEQLLQNTSVICLHYSLQFHIG